MASQTLTVSVWFQVEWHDEAYVWDRAVYPVDVVILDQKRVWRPVLSVFNSVLPHDQLMKADLPLNVNWQGKFRWYPGETLKLDCHVDLTRYPFDMQMCYVHLVQWGQLAAHVNCTEATLRSTVEGNGEWDIVGMSVVRYTSTDDYVCWAVDFQVYLRRKWAFYAVNLLIPVVLVSTLNCLVFLLPVASGEKMSVCVTSFLTLAVFMTLVQDSLPSNSDTVCYLAVYLAVEMAFGALTVLITAVQMALYHKGVGRVRRDRSTKSLVAEEDDLASRSDEGKEEGTRCQKDATCSSCKLQEMTACKSTPERQRCLDRSFSMAVPGTVDEGTPDKRDQLTDRMDSLCFPIFITLNVLSLIIYCFFIFV